METTPGNDYAPAWGSLVMMMMMMIFGHLECAKFGCIDGMGMGQSPAEKLIC